MKKTIKAELVKKLMKHVDSKKFFKYAGHAAHFNLINIY